VGRFAVWFDDLCSARGPQSHDTERMTVFVARPNMLSEHWKEFERLIIKTTI
jgi:hypothetical protein